MRTKHARKTSIGLWGQSSIWDVTKREFGTVSIKLLLWGQSSIWDVTKREFGTVSIKLLISTESEKGSFLALYRLMALQCQLTAKNGPLVVVDYRLTGSPRFAQLCRNLLIFDQF